MANSTIDTLRQNMDNDGYVPDDVLRECRESNNDNREKVQSIDVGCKQAKSTASVNPLFTRQFIAGGGSVTTYSGGMIFMGQ